MGVAVQRCLRSASSDRNVQERYERVARRLLDRIRGGLRLWKKKEIACALLQDAEVFESDGDVQAQRFRCRAADLARCGEHLRQRCASVDEKESVSKRLRDPCKLEISGFLKAPVVLARAEQLAESAISMLDSYVTVARMVLQRVELVGCWDECVEDDVAPELQPLHMNAVREALGALIPPQLQPSLDKAAGKTKDVALAAQAGSVLRMAGWTVNVRAETALARGILQEEALEFFLSRC